MERSNDQVNDPAACGPGDSRGAGANPDGAQCPSDGGASNAAPSAGGENAAARGGGYDCVAPSGRCRIAMWVSLVALLAAGGILVFKTTNAGQGESDNGVAESGSALASRQTASNLAPAGVVRALTPADVGLYLGAFTTLDKVARKWDAVFIFVPDKKNRPAAKDTKTAILAAQKTLDSQRVKIGLFTLMTDSTDYTKVSDKVDLPTVLVSKSGGGLVPVDGEPTEENILEAFVASSSGKCGPGQVCGPGGCN